MRLSGIAVSSVGIVVVICLSSAMGYQLDKPTANLSERFVTPSGWTGAPSGVGVTAGWSSNQNLRVQYPTHSPSDTLLSLGNITGNTNASYGIFSGNLSGMESLSFDVAAKGITTPSLYMKSVSEWSWAYSLSMLPGASSGQWIHVNVPLMFTTGGVTNWSSRNPSHLGSSVFYSDLENIIEIGALTVGNLNDTNAQSFLMDNLKLVGPWGTNLVDGIPIAWALEYGLTNNLNNVGHEDADHDGFGNMSEFLAGTDPTNSSSYFHIDIAHDDQGQVVVKWQDNKYMTFDLLESSNMVTFSAVDGAQGIQGVGTQQVVGVNSIGVTGVRFYKVQIHQ